MTYIDRTTLNQPSRSRQESPDEPSLAELALRAEPGRGLRIFAIALALAFLLAAGLTTAATAVDTDQRQQVLEEITAPSVTAPSAVVEPAPAEPTHPADPAVMDSATDGEEEDDRPLLVAALSRIPLERPSLVR